LKRAAVIPAVTFAASAAWALNAERVPDTSLLIQHLGRGKLIVNGKEWDARKYCNEQSIANPEQIELYQLLRKKTAFVVLCTGTLDGEENVVTLFPAKGWPKSSRVKSEKSKSRVSDDVLRKTIRGLIK
jgi:hypothetical protein